MIKIARQRKDVKVIQVTDENRVYRCSCCDKEYDGATGNFYKTPSIMYSGNGGYYPVCLPCLKDRFKDLSNRYGERMAMTIMCHYLDIPFYYSMYDALIKKNDGFTIGSYVRQMNNKQYQNKSFVNTILDKKELGIDESKFEEIKEEKWKASEHRNKNNVIEIIGYDPFEGYSENQRRFLFSDIIGYLQEDGIEDDNYKISQIIQLVNNNYQIIELNKIISKLNPAIDTKDYNDLNYIKKSLVDSNDKIAKENGISVKNRTNKEQGKGTLTYLTRYLREINLPEAEANYYNQLKSPGTQWAANMSLKAIRENSFFDENDAKDVTEYQYNLIQELREKISDLEENNRLLLIENDELKAGAKK